MYYSIDCNSNQINCSVLTVVDEYSRFPFAFACRNMETKTVILCMNDLFTIYRLPAYVHTDRGSSFTSRDFVSYLNSRGVATSNTSVYNPEGNGQCERYNNIIWTAIKLALKTEVRCRTLVNGVAAGSSFYNIIIVHCYEHHTPRAYVSF